MAEPTISKIREMREQLKLAAADVALGKIQLSQSEVDFVSLLGDVARVLSSIDVLVHKQDALVEIVRSQTVAECARVAREWPMDQALLPSDEQVARLVSEGIAREIESYEPL